MQPESLCVSSKILKAAYLMSLFWCCNEVVTDFIMFSTFKGVFLEIDTPNWFMNLYNIAN